LLEKWLRSDDADVAWVMKTNLSKARMSALGEDWLARQRQSRLTGLVGAVRTREAVPPMPTSDTKTCSSAGQRGPQSRDPD
jgi:hypothetical protein